MASFRETLSKVILNSKILLWANILIVKRITKTLDGGKELKQPKM